jgi:hypothetical protein
MNTAQRLVAGIALVLVLLEVLIPPVRVRRPVPGSPNIFGSNPEGHVWRWRSDIAIDAVDWPRLNGELLFILGISWCVLHLQPGVPARKSETAGRQDRHTLPGTQPALPEDRITEVHPADDPDTTDSSRWKLPSMRRNKRS